MSAIVLSIKGSKLTQARTTLPPILTPAVRRLQKSSHKSGGFSAKAAQKEAIASLMQDSELRERCVRTFFRHPSILIGPSIKRRWCLK